MKKKPCHLVLRMCRAHITTVLFNNKFMVDGPLTENPKKL